MRVVSCLLLLCVMLCGCETRDNPIVAVRPVVVVPTPPKPAPVQPAPPSVKTAYARVTLTCGCTLRIRNLTDCCATAYPDLGVALTSVKKWAFHYRDENEPIDDNPRTTLGGDYQTIAMKCGCPLSVYVPNSCPCFDRTHYPELIKALDQVYALVQKYKK